MIRQLRILRPVPRLAALTLSAALFACAPKNHNGYRTLPQNSTRDTLKAQAFNDEGLRLIEEGEFDVAEAKFRAALAHDVYYASAHNNLGLVLLRSNRHYEAAWEFQYAAKLAPRTAEPRGNLGILYENIGRLDQAISEYEQALQIDPDSVETMGHLARAYVKTGQKKAELAKLLDDLLLLSDDGQWDFWVRGQLIRLGRSKNEKASPRPELEP